MKRGTSFGKGEHISWEELGRRGAHKALDEYYKLLDEYCRPTVDHPRQGLLWTLASHTIFTSAISIAGIVRGVQQVADIAWPWVQPGAIILIPLFLFCIFHTPSEGLGLVPGPEISLLSLLVLLWVVATHHIPEVEQSIPTESLLEWYGDRPSPLQADPAGQQQFEILRDMVQELEVEVYGLEHANSRVPRSVEDCATALNMLALETGIEKQASPGWMRGASATQLQAIARAIQKAIGS